MKIIFFHFILTRFTPILRYFVWNCGILGCFCNFLVINYIIMSKNQYFERLLSPWCIKYFFHRHFSVFSFLFCPVSPQTEASNGGENLFDNKNQFFSDISTIFSIILNLVWAIFSKDFRLKNYQRFWGPMDPVRAN